MRRLCICKLGSWSCKEGGREGGGFRQSDLHPSLPPFPRSLPPPPKGRSAVLRTPTGRRRDILALLYFAAHFENRAISLTGWRKDGRLCMFVLLRSGNELPTHILTTSRNRDSKSGSCLRRTRTGRRPGSTHTSPWGSLSRYLFS